jgi:hypothetical protein
VPPAAGTPGLVVRPAGLRAALRTRERPTTTSATAVGGKHAAEVGRGRPALGVVWNLKQHNLIHSLRIPRNAFANGLPAAKPRRRLGCRVLKFSNTG